MTQAAVRTDVTFEQFLELEFDENHIYELIGGVIVPMAEPSGWHESIRSNLFFTLEFERRRSKLPLEVHPKPLCKLGKRDGRRPDLIAINRQRWAEATKTEAALYVPPEVAIEIVSTNWEEDYQKKGLWYAAFGVLEYWIVDSLEVTKRYPNRRNPEIQVPTVSVGGLNLTTKEYEWQRFTGTEVIQSFQFPALELTVEQLFMAEAG